ncbi:hypothetical protein TNCV_1101541 [Trichonephila clavipes]|nr:hypothetical protein TNCV_1101541 [Trichonephila clavipes]
MYGPIFMRMRNQWVAESQIERHAGSSRPSMTKARENRHIMRSALQNRTITSRNHYSGNGHVCTPPISARMIRRRL